MANVSYQLYCSRNWPIDEVLPMLAKTGYSQVEGYRGLWTDAAAFRGKLDDHGLSMTSCHMGLDVCAGETAATIQTAKTLGIQKVYVPFLAPDDRPSDAAGWAKIGQQVAETAKPFNDAGLSLGWHNHDFELIDLGGADRPLDLIAAGGDEVKLELDLGWVKRAGENPVNWINKFGSQITAVHIKDIAPNGENADEDGWADVGHGVMDWPAITDALKYIGIDHLVAEHDNPNDHARFAQRSLATISAF